MLDLWKSKFPKFHRSLRRPDTKNEQPITRRFEASYPQDQPTFQISQFTLLLFSKKQKEKRKKGRNSVFDVIGLRVQRAYREPSNRESVVELNRSDDTV